MLKTHKVFGLSIAMMAATSVAIALAGCAEVPPPAGTMPSMNGQSHASATGSKGEPQPRSPWRTRSGALQSSASIPAAVHACRATIKASTQNWTEATDADVAAHRACAHGGVIPTPAPWQERFATLLAAAQTETTAAEKHPSAAQSASLHAWFDARIGMFDFTWDGHRGSLARAHGWLTASHAGDEETARTALTVELAVRIEGTCTPTPGAEWVTVTSGKPNPDSDHQAVRKRWYHGVPVRGDKVEISYGADAVNKARWRATALSLVCTPIGPALAHTAKVSQAAAEATAASAFLPSAVAVDFKSRLVVMDPGSGAHLAWEIRVRKVDDDQFVDVDALTGNVLQVRGARAHGTHSGSITMQIRRPYSSALATGVFSNAKLYEDDTQQDLLGATSDAGVYTSITHPDQNDHNWELYFAGNWLKENASPLTDIAGFTAGSAPSAYADFTSQSLQTQRRAETFYLLNYARQLARAADSNVDLYEESPCPQGDTSCTAILFNIPQIAAANCNGDFGGGWLNVHGYCSSQSTATQEQALRYFTMHEWGHSTRDAEQGTPGCALCWAWDEGRSDYFSYAATRLEFLRSNGLGGGCGTDSTCSGSDDFYPDDRMGTGTGDDSCPASCDAGLHDAGNIFAATWLELHYDLGWRDTMARAHESVDEIDANTVWEGSSNTFHAEMLESDSQYWSIGAWQHTISKAFARHDATVADSSWFLNDQWPGAANPAYMLRLGSTTTTIDRGESTAEPDLAYDFWNDSDYVWIYTYAGETYTFDTPAFGTGVEPFMSFIRMSGGSESVTASNDCVANSPCLQFVANVTGWAAIRVGGSIGNTGWYDLTIKVDDDVGDAGAKSTAIANDGTWYNGSWEATADVDYFRVYVNEDGGSVQLELETCEQTAGQNPDTLITMYYQDDLTTSVASNDDGGTCGTAGTLRSSKFTYNVPTGKKGFYYIKVHEWEDNATGSYKIKATQINGNRDVGGSSTGTALALSDNELTGRYVAADLSSSSDDDWISVSLAENEHVTFHTQDLKGDCDTVMTIQDNGTNGYSRVPDSTKRWMREDDDGGFDARTSQLHFVAPNAGTYFLRIRPFSSTSLGAYTLYVQRMGNFAPAQPAWQ